MLRRQFFKTLAAVAAAALLPKKKVQMPDPVFLTTTASPELGPRYDEDVVYVSGSHWINFIKTE